MGYEIAIAGQLDLPDGRRIWIPPPGAQWPRPFWVNAAGTTDLTAAEIEKYLRRNNGSNAIEEKEIEPSFITCDTRR